MVSIDLITNAFATFFVTIHPHGQVAIFLGLTSGMSSVTRRQIAWRGVVIGMVILLGFMFLGAPILSTLGISMAAFRVAGGALLFYTAFEMVFEKRVERKGDTAERIVSRHELQSIAVFPLAIPLIAGPGAISASILLAGDFVTPTDKVVLASVLLSVGLILYVGLLLADQLNKIIGETIQVVLTRLLGIILAALSVQYIAEGILTLAANGS